MGRSTVTQSTAIALGSLLIIVMAGLGALAEEQPRIDPRSLVGEWIGSWKPTHQTGAGRTEGPYRILIRRVKGSRVFGRVEAAGRRQEQFNFVGTLDGNRLTYRRAHLTVYVGDNLMQMRGSEGGTMPIEITLRKTK